MDGIYFLYDGIKSSDMGVYLVKLNSGMFPTPFLPEREIVSEQVVGVPIPYVYGYKYNPLKVNLTLASMDSNFWTFEKKREIARWLDCGRFAQFASEDFIEKNYFLTYEGGIDLTTNGAQEGYIQVQMRNISPYTYSAEMKMTWDFSTITSPKIFQFNNIGDTVLYPYDMWIEKHGVGDISILNLNDGGREFKFTNISDLETLHIQNRDRVIETSLSNTFRYDAFNKNYFRLQYGMNNLQITGACRLAIETRFEFKG